MPRLTLNGQPVNMALPPEMPLLWALRDAANLTGAKYGCGTGHCGACTVLVDGQAQRSCQLPIGTLEGAAITTIEGLSADRTHPVQQAFAAANVSQCGYCIPGMVLTAAALLERNPRPADADIDAAMTNICRCGVQPRLRAAIRLAARVRAGEERIAAATPSGVDPANAARAAPSLAPSETERKD